jgi:hypothetical protein
MSSLVDEMGVCNLFLRCAWKICELERCGYVALELEGGIARSCDEKHCQ